MEQKRVHSLQESVSQRILSKFKPGSVLECWEWTAYKNRKGYGTVYNDGSVTLAHRLIYTLVIGPIPDGKLACHKCDNPGCVNPFHIFIGDNLMNNLDMVLKGRYNRARNMTYNKFRRGENHTNAKLTDTDIRLIRKDKETMTYEELSLKHHIAQGHLHRIVNGQSWRHIS